MREVKVIPIEIEKGLKKEFTISELTIQNILDLSQTNSLLGGVETQKPGVTLPGFYFMNQLLSFRPDVEHIMAVSCDFKYDDLLALAPSDVKVLLDGFLEVNQTFLDVLEKMGAGQILRSIIRDFITNCLRFPVI